MKIIPCKFWKFREVNSYVVELYRGEELHFLNTVIADDCQKIGYLLNFLL